MFERLLRGPVDAAPCESVAQWWPRHRELLKVASSARDLRTARAWENLRRPEPAPG